MRNSISRESIVVIGGVMFFVVAIFGLIFAQQSLRLDEAQSLFQASHSPGTILYIIGQDVHVPLYLLLLHGWMTFVGEGVIAARALSLMFFLLSIPALFLLGKEAVNERAGLFVAVLFGVSPYMNWFGSEIRMYSLLAFIIIVHQYFFLRLYKNKIPAFSKNPGLWLGYGIASIAGIYTHYFFFLGMFAQAVFLFIKKRWLTKGGRKRRVFRRSAAAAGIIFASLVPWLAYVVHLGFAQNMRPLLARPDGAYVIVSIMEYIFGFQSENIMSLLFSLWPMAVLLVFLALQRREKILTPMAEYFVIAFSVPIAVVYIVSVTLQPMFLARYLILTLPALYILIAWVFSLYSPTIRKIGEGAVISLVVTALFLQVVNPLAPVKEPYREVAEYLSSRSGANDIIAVSAPFTIYPIEYYYTGPSSITTIPFWSRQEIGPIPTFSGEAIEAQMSAMGSSYAVAWVVLSYDQGYENELVEYFESRFERISERVFHPDIRVYGFRLIEEDGDARFFFARMLRDRTVETAAGHLTSP